MNFPQNNNSRAPSFFPLLSSDPLDFAICQAEKNEQESLNAKTQLSAYLIFKLGFQCGELHNYKQKLAEEYRIVKSQIEQIPITKFADWESFQKLVQTKIQEISSKIESVIKKNKLYEDTVKLHLPLDGKPSPQERIGNCLAIKFLLNIFEDLLNGMNSFENAFQKMEEYRQENILKWERKNNPSMPSIILQYLETLSIGLNEEQQQQLLAFAKKASASKELNEFLVPFELFSQVVDAIVTAIGKTIYFGGISETCLTIAPVNFKEFNKCVSQLDAGFRRNSDINKAVRQVTPDFVKEAFKLLARIDGKLKRLDKYMASDWGTKKNRVYNSLTAIEYFALMGVGGVASHLSKSLAQNIKNGLNALPYISQRAPKIAANSTIQVGTQIHKAERMYIHLDQGGTLDLKLFYSEEQQLTVFVNLLLATAEKSSGVAIQALRAIKQLGANKGAKDLYLEFIVGNEQLYEIACKKLIQVPNIKGVIDTTRPRFKITLDDSIKSSQSTVLNEFSSLAPLIFMTTALEISSFARNILQEENAKPSILEILEMDDDGDDDVFKLTPQSQSSAQRSYEESLYNRLNRFEGIY